MSAVSRPPLPRAEAGRPVTAQAWNELLRAVTAFDLSFGPAAASGWVRIDVRFREGPVPGARVVAVPASSGGRPSGPPIAAVPDGADGSSFRLPASVPGTFTVFAEAPGFVTGSDTLTIPAAASGAPPAQVAKLELELVASHLVVPDVVGFVSLRAAFLLQFAGFESGIVRRVQGATANDPDGTVVQQFPAAETLVAVSATGPVLPLPRPSGPVQVNMTYLPLPAASRFTASGGAWRGHVPLLVGLTLDRFGNLASQGFSLQGTTGATGTDFVVSQDLPAGSVVATGGPLSVTVARGDISTTSLGAFAGTHAKLAGRTARDVFVMLGGRQPAVDLFAARLVSISTPWQLARFSAPDSLIAEIRAQFAAIGAPIDATAAGQGLAEAWQTLSVVQYAGIR